MLRALIFSYFIFTALFSVQVASAESVKEANHEHLLYRKLNAEIVDVEELKEPLGSALYTVKDLSSGKTIKLYADVHRSLIQMGESIKSAGDVLGGSKATIIYQDSKASSTPEVVFAKVASSY